MTFSFFMDGSLWCLKWSWFWTRSSSYQVSRATESWNIPQKTFFVCNFRSINERERALTKHSGHMGYAYYFIDQMPEFPLFLLNNFWEHQFLAWWFFVTFLLKCGHCVWWAVYTCEALYFLLLCILCGHKSCKIATRNFLLKKIVRLLWAALLLKRLVWKWESGILLFLRTR